MSTDIVIVGTGAAGISLAESLDDGTRRILLVEAGGMEVDYTIQPKTCFQSIGEPADGITDQFHAFGGMTRYWTGRVGMLDPIDVETRPWVAHSGWPIAWDELSAFEGKAMEQCGFKPDWKSEPAPLANLALLDHRPPELMPYAWRYWSVSRERFQHWGNRVEPRFRNSATVTVLLHTAMIGVSQWQDNRVKACLLRTRDGSDIIVEADQFIICGGGVESTRLVLNMAEASPTVFASIKPALGRYFMQHYRAVTGIIEAAPDQSACLQAAFNRFRKPKGQQFETGVSLSAVVQEKLGLLNAAAWLGYRRKGMRLDDINLRRATEAVVRRIAGRAPLVGHAEALITLDVEQEPCSASRIFLTDDRDRNGLKQAVIDWRISPRDYRTQSFLTSLMVDWFNTLGLGQARPVDGIVEESGVPREFMLDSHHHLGATRMSHGPEDGVVDHNLRIHGLQNMFICSGSVMPTGGHVNPTLSIVVLALRLAAHLKRLG